MKWDKRGRLLFDTFLEASSLVRKAVFFKSMTQAAKEKSASNRSWTYDPNSAY